jgi:MoxR-like ATPase
MEERQITVAGKTYSLPELFMVLATQNPIEQEGTYPLPEAQMDRFLMKIAIDYPEDDTELDIMRLVRGEESQAKVTTSAAEVSIPQQAILEAREQIHKLQIAEPMERYIVALVMATRDPARYSEQLGSWISVGSSPRASIALDKCARAHAWMQGRDYVSPEDIQAVAPDVLGHRVIVSYTAQAEGISAAEIVREILQNVAVA